MRRHHARTPNSLHARAPIARVKTQASVHTCRELLEIETDAGRLRVNERAAAAAAASLMPLLSSPGRRLLVPSSPADLPDACPDSFRRHFRMASVLDSNAPKHALLRTFAAAMPPPLIDEPEKQSGRGRANHVDSQTATAVSVPELGPTALPEADFKAAADPDSEARAGPGSPPAPPPLSPALCGRPAQRRLRCGCCVRPLAPVPGPGGPRACRDVPWMVALALVWAGWAVLGWAAFSFGCPERCNDPRRMVNMT
jgi:hypothetical protein